MPNSDLYMGVMPHAVYNVIFGDFFYQTDRAYYAINASDDILRVWLNGASPDDECSYLLRLPDGKTAVGGDIVTETVRAHEARDPLFGLAPREKDVPTGDLLGALDPRTGNYEFLPNGCTYIGAPGENIIWVTEMDGTVWGIPVLDAGETDPAPLDSIETFSRAIWRHVRLHD